MYHTPSTLVPTDTLQNHTESVRAHQAGSASSIGDDVRASIITDQSEDIHTKAVQQPTSVWDLQDAKCILSKNSECCIDVKGFRFYTMERLSYALQLLSMGDKKFIRQLAKYTRMDYVKKCVNTRFELASPIVQDKWLCEQFQTWIQIITARILSDPPFKQALLDSVGSPLCDPDDPLYSSAVMSSRNMCAKQKVLSWPLWIDRPTRLTRGQVGP